MTPGPDSLTIYACVTENLPPHPPQGSPYNDDASRRSLRSYPFCWCDVLTFIFNHCVKLYLYNLWKEWSFDTCFVFSGELTSNLKSMIVEHGMVFHWVVLFIISRIKNYVSKLRDRWSFTYGNNWKGDVWPNTFANRVMLCLYFLGSKWSRVRSWPYNYPAWVRKGDSLRRVGPRFSVTLHW